MADKRGWSDPSEVLLRDSGGETLARSGLKIAHLRMIVALEEHGQVSAAASVLNISQPAASRMIAEMEAILGAPICDRLPRGVALTPYGTALARRAKAVLLELREVDREVSELKAGKGGSIFLGAVTAPAIELVIPAIKIVRERYPKVEINMQVETSSVLAKELLASRHDFIIARIPDDLNPRLFEARVIGVEKACLIVRRGHPLMARPVVRLEELHGFDWVLQPGGSLLRRTLEGIFVSHNAPLPDRILNTSSLLLTLVMVAQTDAIAAVSLEVAKFLKGRGELDGSVEILPIEFDIVVQPYSLITVRDRSLSPAAQILYDQIRNQIR
jgi:DNA-binding transcriptional LysR family regulator